MLQWDDAFEECIRRSLPALSASDPLAPDTDLQAFGLDSLAVIGITVEIESIYQITVPDEAVDFATFGTPAAIWLMIQQQR